jgi:hypothetical protein
MQHDEIDFDLFMLGSAPGLRTCAGREPSQRSSTAEMGPLAAMSAVKTAVLRTWAAQTN